MGNNREAQFVAILGATGCGKSTELKKRLGKGRRRTIIWSPKEPLDNYAAFYPGTSVCSTVSEVLQIVSDAKKTGCFHVVFIPTLNQKKDTAMFDVVCKIALAAGRIVLVVEELHTVTQASFAPDGWRKLCFMGRGFGVEVFGLSQRPASVDKSFMGSLSFIHAGRMPHPPDQKAVAEIMGIDRSEISAISGYGAIQKDMFTGKITRK